MPSPGRKIRGSPALHAPEGQALALAGRRPRAVLRLSLTLALLIGVPTLIIGPGVLLLLHGAAAASALLATLAANLAALSVSLITAALGFALLAALLRKLLRGR